jgi:hypothetical protein
MVHIIFITGISGYIGGQVLHDITKKHPEYQVRGLVRTKEQQQQIASKYPFVKTVIGDLDSAEVLKAEAAQVDVVLRTSAFLRAPGMKANTKFQNWQTRTTTPPSSPFSLLSKRREHSFSSLVQLQSLPQATDSGNSRPRNGLTSRI